MKTAMQELIDELHNMTNDKSLSLDYRASIVVAMQMAKNYLPKEREQIEQAYDAGQNHFHDRQFIGVDMVTASDYFTQTYNTPKP